MLMKSGEDGQFEMSLGTAVTEWDKKAQQGQRTQARMTENEENQYKRARKMEKEITIYTYIYKKKGQTASKKKDKIDERNRRI